jgi:hypothetical protein
METYKFETKVLKNGVIKLPQLEQFYNRKIELFIVLKKEKEKIKDINAEDFLKQWTGFIPNSDPDIEKFNYLMNKHK